MRAISRRLTHDETGQSVVIFVLTATALFTSAALVINVGHFLQARQLAQGTADAAALAAAQEDPRVVFDGIDAASDYTGLNWPGAGVTDYQELGRYPGNPSYQRTGEDVSLTIEKNVPALFAGFLDSIGVSLLSLSVKAHATARSEPVRIVNQISPLALRCNLTCQDKVLNYVTPGTPASLEYPWAPDGSEVVSFVFLPGDPPNSEFGPVGLRFGSGFVDATNFDTFMACDPSIAAMSSCNQDDSESSNDSPASCGPPPPLADSPPCWYPRVNFPGTEQQKAQQLASALQGAGDWPHLVAIYDTVDRLSPADSFGYHVIGWAYYQFETNVVTDSAGDIVRIELTGTFHKLFVNASRLSNSGFGGSLNDFGVRAVGLSADLP